MHVTPSIARVLLLLMAAGFCAAPAIAQAPPTGVPAEEETDAPAPREGDKPGETDILRDIDISSLDWSQLNFDASMLDLAPLKARAAAKNMADNGASWSSTAKDNGASSVKVKQSISPFWDTRIGADMTVVNPSVASSGDILRQKYSPDAAPSQSSGTAWAAVTAPGVGSIWDKTTVEARVDPTQEQSKLGTAISKSLPLNEQYSLTLQGGYNVIQQGLVPVPGVPGHPARSFETDQSAKLSITDTGTSFTAGRTLSSTDDRWLGKVGAEQKLFDGVTISGSIGETATGAVNKSFSAGFKRSW